MKIKLNNSLIYKHLQEIIRT